MIESVRSGRRRLWRRKSETESWFAPKRERVVCAKGRVAPPPHHCHWTSSSLIIGWWSFGFTRSGFVTSCSAVTFSLEQDTLPADLISSDQPLYHDHPVLAIIISFIVASHHHGQTSISHRVSPTLKSSTLSTPISSQPYVDYNLSLFQAAAASCPREIQLTLCTKWHWHQKQHNTKLTNSENCHQGWFSSSNTTLLSSSVTHASVISMKWSPIKMCTCMSMSNLKLTNRQTYSCVKQIIHSEPPPSVIICHPHLTLMYHSPSGER